MRKSYLQTIASLHEGILVVVVVRVEDLDAFHRQRVECIPMLVHWGRFEGLGLDEMLDSAEGGDQSRHDMIIYEGRRE
jgi:hypothetical protein